MSRAWREPRHETPWPLLEGIDLLERIRQLSRGLPEILRLPGRSVIDLSLQGLDAFVRSLRAVGAPMLWAASVWAGQSIRKRVPLRASTEPARPPASQDREAGAEIHPLTEPVSDRFVVLQPGFRIPGEITGADPPSVLGAEARATPGALHPPVPGDVGNLGQRVGRSTKIASWPCATE